MVFTGVLSFWIDVVKMVAIRKIENGIKAEIGRVKRRGNNFLLGKKKRADLKGQLFLNKLMYQRF